MSADRTSLRWTVSQMGAREHYAVPRGFHAKGELRRFYTEMWCRGGAPILRRGPQAIRSFAGRHHPDLPSNLVVSFTPAAVHKRFQFALRKKSIMSVEGQRWDIEFGKWFAQEVNRDLERRQPMDPERDWFFGFLTASLETLQMLREQDICTIVDQAGPPEDDSVLKEMERWPGWAPAVDEQGGGGGAAGHAAQFYIEDYYQRWRQEWDAASLVLVNSEWSKKSLVARGVPAQKVVVVPLAFEPDCTNVLPRSAPAGPLRVLWLGNVILRKGIQYLMAAARDLSDTDIQFIVAGKIGISEHALGTAPPSMRFVGRVTRAQAAEWYRHADVFVLPTVSEGFAITQLEAMAMGLPVITTPNCGEVVTHGVDGLIVPACDSESLAQAIAKLNDDRQLIASMSRQAIRKSRQFTVRRYADTVDDAARAYRRDAVLRR